MSLVDKIDQYLKRLFPINRSITGNGNRETLRILQELIPLKIKEYRSGTPVFDWIIPDEWNVNDAWIKDSNGKKLIDFQESNLHLVSYSQPINKKMTFDELKPHLHYHAELKDAIPYRTVYYKHDWGFCLNQKQYAAISQTVEPLEVMIDSNFNENGSMTFGELLIPGTSKKEILISTYICHPSLANDNLSGVVLTAFLAKELLNQINLKRSYRIIWIPETIGAIAYCALNEAIMRKIDVGLVVTSVGGPGQFGYKKSHDTNHSVNTIIEKVFEEEGIDFISYPFDIHGSDERQYSSQGFRINVTSITKDKYYEYPFYHTSLDNLDYIDAKNISSSLNLHLKVLKKLNDEPIYQNLFPNCEVMFSKHDLYPQIGGAQMPSFSNKSELDLILWLMWLCDGKRGLYEIEKKLDTPIFAIEKVINKLIDKNLIKSIT